MKKMKTAGSLAWWKQSTTLNLYEKFCTLHCWQAKILTLKFTLYHYPKYLVKVAKINRPMTYYV